MWLQGDFASKFWIGIMAGNIIKQSLVNSMCLNMQKHDMWMVYNGCNNTKETYITNMNRDRIVSKNGNYN